VTFSPYRSRIISQLLSWLTDVSLTDVKCCEGLCVCVRVRVHACVVRVCARARAEMLMWGSDKALF
jgi:hypothetical protein